MRPGGKFADVVDRRINDCRSAQMAILQQELQDARLAELNVLRCGRVRFNQTVGVKKEYVAFFQMQRFAFAGM